MSNTNVPTNVTCGGCGEDAFPPTEVDAVAVFTIVSLMVFGLCLLIFFFSLIFGICRRMAFLEDEEDELSDESGEEKIRKRKENILNGLIVKEWVLDDPEQAESTEGGQDTPPSREMVEAPQSPAPPINSSPASCAMGSEDCDFVAGGEEEEMAGCAICLSQFRPQQLVCESNNASCQHVFHTDCMVDWLMKNHEKSCPMCREVYLLVKTV